MQDQLRSGREILVQEQRSKPIDASVTSHPILIIEQHTYARLTVSTSDGWVLQQVILGRLGICCYA